MCKIINFQERVAKMSKVDYVREGNTLYITANEVRVLIFLNLKHEKNSSIKDRVCYFLENRKKKFTKVTCSNFKKEFLKEIKEVSGVNDFSCQYIWFEIEEIISKCNSFKYLIEKNDTLTFKVSNNYKIVG